VNDVADMKAIEFTLLDWDELAKLPIEKLQQKNVRSLLLGLIESGLITKIALVNSKYLANSKCFEFPQIYWFQKRISFHWYTTAEIMIERIDCIVDSCIRSSEASIFFVTNSPIPFRHLQEAGYITQRQVDLFEGDPKTSYFLGAYGESIHQNLFNISKTKSGSQAIAFFTHDAQSIVMTS
jgi:hypothetical protein